MGRHTGTESAIALLVALLKQRTWKQAELARHLEIGVPALRTRLAELRTAGVPLDDEKEHPHVYWSVPKTWAPGAIQLDANELGELLRVLRRAPDDAARERVLSRILAAQGGARTSIAPGAVSSGAPLAEAAQWLPILEDAAAHREALSIRYLSATKSAPEFREVSPHQVHIGPPIRMYATCHRSGELRNFRIDRVLSARPIGKSGYRPAQPAALAEFIATSVNGFRSAEAPQLVAFSVRNPEARWVRSNLPSGLIAADEGDGIRVSGTVAATMQVARFVVSLGGAALAETTELRALVRDLARESLVVHDAAERVSSEVYLSAADGASTRRKDEKR